MPAAFLLLRTPTLRGTWKEPALPAVASWRLVWLGFWLYGALPTGNE